MDAYYERLRARAQRTFQSISIKDALKNTRAIVGPRIAPGDDPDGLAQQALDMLQEGDPDNMPSPKQLAALELVVRTMRPAPLAQNGELQELNQDFKEVFPNWDSFRQSVKPFLYSIGRINTLPDEGVGTGFLVADGILVTNKHVLDKLSTGTYVLEKGQAVVDFKHEYDSATEPPVDIIGVRAVHQTLDMVLLELAKTDSGRPPLKVSTTVATPGQQVVAIGYPFNDTFDNPQFVGAIFGNDFGVKRAAPGEVVELGKQSLFHDCSTLGGNSGSPVISMDTVNVLGLHCSGRFVYRNEAVCAAALGQFVQSNI
ncbi:MAG: serine protease Do [Blastocatellia bacterium]|jgi:S1-C subfamily serine protease|nr:serine protease Do [Blastocatellia bacterium]